MPIYAYRCQDCGFEKDELQKMSAAPLTLCPSCGTQGFARKLTAPAFQLKGSGWYVTDFRDGGAGKKKTEGSGEGAAKEGTAKEGGAADTPSGSSGAASSGASGEGKTSDSKSASAASADSKPAAAAPAASSSPAGGAGTSA